MCGLNFYTTPWIHFSGNFFTAKCSYIKKLLPIDEFGRRISDLADKTIEYEKQGRFLFHMSLGSSVETYLGKGRYANEVWPASHPSLVACDLSIPRQVDFWKKPRGSPEEFLQYWNFSLAPRQNDTRGRFLHIRRTLRNQATYRMREYYLLAGNIFKWIHLYGEVPPESSWIWSYFPDGEEWINGWNMWKKDVVEVLLDPFAMQDGNLSDPIFKNITKYPNQYQRQDNATHQRLNKMDDSSISRRRTTYRPKERNRARARTKTSIRVIS
jgi:hypothetical protein